MALKYTGAGRFIPGVPARNLSDDEEREFAKIIKQYEKSDPGLYEPVHKPAEPVKDGEK